MTAGPTPPFPPGLRQRYRLVRALGRGGMGLVAAVEDRQLGRVVALKLSTLLGNKEAQARFLREAQAAAAIRHPNVIEVYDSGIVDGIPFLTMELVEGRSLDEPPVPPDLEAVFLQVAEALEAVHAAGMVHRDVKPANVMLAGSRVLLTDFGLVHDPSRTALTQEGSIPGTFAFFAPEQLRGGVVTPAADWWALGVSVFQVVEGRTPFQVDEVLGFLEGEARALPPFTRLAEDSRLARMARAWTAWDPKERPASVMALEARLAGPGSSPRPGARGAVPVVPASVAPPTPPGRAAGVGPGGLAGVLLLGVLVGAYGIQEPAAPARVVEVAPAEAPAPLEPPDIRAAREALASSQVQEDLLDPDPAVWARALGEVPALEALRARLGDPQAEAALAIIDDDLGRLGLPPLFAPLVVPPAPRSPPEPVELPRTPSFVEVHRYWPAAPGPHLARAARAALELDAAYGRMVKDIQAAEGNSQISAEFPFDGAGTTWFMINGWQVARDQLTEYPRIRARARAWFRPGIAAYRAMIGALARSLREEPGTRAAALSLAFQVLGQSFRVLMGWVGALEARWHLGLDPASAEEAALHGMVLDQLLLRDYRRHLPPPERLEPLRSAMAKVLARPGQDLGEVGPRSYFLIVATRWGTPQRILPFPANLGAHLEASMRHLPRPDATSLLASVVQSEARDPEARALDPATARRILDFLDAEPGAWAAYAERDRRAWRAHLEAVGGG